MIDASASYNVVKYGSRNDDEQVLVDVVVPVFNAEQTLERAVCSIFEQETSAHIILIDDASTDNSRDVIHDICSSYDGKFTVVESFTNQGVSHARNIGITQARTKYLAFLDADDIWLPSKITRQLDVISSKPDVVLVTCDSYQVRPNGEILSQNHDLHKTVNGEDAWKELLRQNFLPTPTVLTRTLLVKELGGFNTTLAISEDLDLWIRIAKRGKVYVIPEVLAHYFDYSTSLMKRGGYDQQKLVMEMLKPHLDDAKLSDKERNELTSCRYVEMSKGISRLHPEKMEALLDKALEHGYSASEIRKLRTKRAAKRVLRKLRLI